jgi:hypothetical protein
LKRPKQSLFIFSGSPCPKKETKYDIQQIHQYQQYLARMLWNKSGSLGHVEKFIRFVSAFPSGHLHQFGFGGGGLGGPEGHDAGNCQLQLRQHRPFGALA